MQALAEGSPSAPMLQTVNYVADAIAEEFPTVAIDTLAYSYTHSPPNATRPRPNVIVRLCTIECNFGVPMTDVTNVGCARDLRTWSTITERIYVWNYQINFGSYLTPYPNWYSVGPNVRFFAEHGVKGIFQEAAHNGPGSDLAELRDYVTASMMWDPTQQPQTLIAEFLDGFYGGAAAPYVKRYMDILHESVLNTSFVVSSGFDGVNPSYLTPPVVLRAAAALVAARQAAAGSSLHQEHVNRSSIPILYVALKRFQELYDYATEYYSGESWPLGATVEDTFRTLSVAVRNVEAAYDAGPSCVPWVEDKCGRVVEREHGPVFNLSSFHAELFLPCYEGWQRASSGGCEPLCLGGVHAENQTLARFMLPVSATASSGEPTLNGNWNSGRPAPQWIELGYSSNRTLLLTLLEASLTLALPRYVAGGATTSHAIFVDGVLVHRWQQLNITKGGGQLLSWRPAPALAVHRSIRILTDASPQNVSWNRIYVYSC